MEKERRTTRLLLKNDGIQYRARVRRRLGTAVSQTYKETTFALYFLYYRSRQLCVYVRSYVGGRRKCILEKGNIYGRGRFVPADRFIGRDFKADCSYKVKNFSKSGGMCLYILPQTCTYSVMCVCSPYMSNLYCHYEESRHKVSPIFRHRVFFLPYHCLPCYKKIFINNYLL